MSLAIGDQVYLSPSVVPRIWVEGGLSIFWCPTLTEVGRLAISHLLSIQRRTLTTTATPRVFWELCARSWGRAKTYHDITKVFLLSFQVPLERLWCVCSPPGLQLPADLSTTQAAFPCTGRVGNTSNLLSEAWSEPRRTCW